MNYTHLGRTGLKVSRLCLGTMNFGDVTDEKTSARILDEALEAGINFIDTADVYGTEQSPDIQQGSGLSEEIIGRWLQQGGRRERIVLATKVYQPMGPGPNDRRLSAYHIRKACEDSLRRLKTDHIDVYNRNGLPIGQIVLPDRDKGRNLKSTSLAIRPGHRELFIVANSGTEPGGAMIFRSGAFAPAPFPFSHQ